MRARRARVVDSPVIERKIFFVEVPDKPTFKEVCARLRIFPIFMVITQGVESPHSMETGIKLAVCGTEAEKHCLDEQPECVVSLFWPSQEGRNATIVERLRDYERIYL